MSRTTRLNKKRKQAVVAESPCKHCEFAAVCLPLSGEAVAVDHCIYCGESKLSFPNPRMVWGDSKWLRLQPYLQRVCPRVEAYVVQVKREKCYNGMLCCDMPSCRNRHRLDNEELELKIHQRAQEAQRIRELAGSANRIPEKRERRIPRLRGGKKIWGSKSYRPLDEEK